MKRLLLTAGLLGLLSMNAAAQQQVIPTPWWTAFYDSLSNYNGSLAPVGSVVRAYAPGGILCGQQITASPGLMRFMPVYGDDPFSPGVVEGATDQQMISFTINDRPASVLKGDPIWANNSWKQITLSSNAAVNFSVGSYQTLLFGRPHDTVRFSINVRNTGNGLDLYSVDVVGSKKDTSITDRWTIIPRDTVYANPGQTVQIYFDVVVAQWPGTPAIDSLTFTVYSRFDPTKRFTGTSSLTADRALDVDDPSTLPNGFTLNQNYPNPFNPTTTISFSLASRSAVQLEVFDILGRSVYSRDLGALPSGTHEFEYDASNLASGVYLYRILTDRGSQAKKMMLLK